MTHRKSSEDKLRKVTLLTYTAQEIQINIGGISISNSKCEKLHIENKQTFETHAFK